MGQRRSALRERTRLSIPPRMHRWGPPPLRRHEDIRGESRCLSGGPGGHLFTGPPLGQDPALRLRLWRIALSSVADFLDLQ